MCNQSTDKKNMIEQPLRHLPERTEQANKQTSGLKRVVHGGLLRLIFLAY